MAGGFSLTYVGSTFVEPTQHQKHCYECFVNHFFDWDEDGDADLNSRNLKDFDDEAYEYF